MLKKRYPNTNTNTNTSPPDIQDDETEAPFSLISPYLSTSSWSRWRNLLPERKLLGSGMMLIKNCVNLMGQVEIVNMCQTWGVDHGGFYQPSGAKVPLHMMCFGRNWDPVTRYDNPYWSDGSEPPPIPDDLSLFAESVVEDARYLLYEDKLPLMCPDVCVVNFYSKSGPLGLSLHQDCDESSDSLERGLPVVTIAIGDSVEFLYRHSDENKLHEILLESGDVLVFSGEDRHIFHVIERVIPSSCPTQLGNATRLASGHLNLSLRQF
ncbi:putative DNA oxidative demethylase [Helianthus debilis subsp. tardiflorus]